MSQTNLYKSNNPPNLPQDEYNQTLVNYQGKLRSIRIQDININGHTITIARIKIPSPEKLSSHLIKRFDTNAISASSFFRSAFPHSTEEEEAIQMQYLHQIYDTHTAGAVEFGSARKLTGVWVPIENAAELAEVYGLTRFAEPLLAFPNPKENPRSPTGTKKGGEDQSSTTQTPKASQQSKLTDQISVTRSSKRSRAGPLGFGNTSPSSFSLSSFTKPSNETKKSGTHDDSKSTNDENDEKPASPTDRVAGRGARNSPSKKPTTVDENHEHTEHQDHQLIGTDELALRAKQEALKLVSELKNSQPCTQSSLGSPTNTLETELTRTTSPAKSNKVTRKRSSDEVSFEEEEQGEDEDEERISDGTATHRSFLPKLLWRKSAAQAHPTSKKHKRTQLAGGGSSSSSSKSFVPLPTNSATPSVDDSSSTLNPNKRNLAIAGIVIAGAAASIAPYFF